MGGFARVRPFDEEHAMPRYYFYLREAAAPPHITGAVFQDTAAAAEKMLIKAHTCCLSKWANSALLANQKLRNARIDAA